MSVKDDGVGFDPAAVRGRGLGLIGMQERVMELGGELSLVSQPGKGTALSARIPSRRGGGSRMAVRILLADDHGVVRKGLRFLLERQPGMEVAGEASDGREAVRLAETANPDIVIMDIAMPLLNGIDATAQIIKRDPNIGVIILSMHSDEDYLLSALNAGAKGFLLKESAEVDLVRAIQAVVKGTPFFSPEIAKTMLEDYMRFLQQRNLQDSYDLLTEREKEVLQLLAEGKSNKEVAAILDISVYTVDTHRTALDAEVKPAQYGGDRLVCRPQEDHRVRRGLIGEICGSRSDTAENRRRPPRRSFMRRSVSLRGGASVLFRRARGHTEVADSASFPLWYRTQSRGEPPSPG